MDNRFRTNRSSPRCGFYVKRRKFYFGDTNISFGSHYELDYVPQIELHEKNWNVQNWITKNENGDLVYDGCAAFQQVLNGKSSKPK